LGKLKLERKGEIGEDAPHAGSRSEDGSEREQIKKENRSAKGGLKCRKEGDRGLGREGEVGVHRE